MRPEVACYCAHITPIPTRTRVLVLSHPREFDNPVGTARMASLCLPNSEVAVGVDFSADPTVQRVLRDPARPPIVLYPGEGARDLEREPPDGPCTLVVVDGTWHHARSMLRKNPFLRELPCYMFRPPRPSEYRIRREPAAEYVSTIEALMHALSFLEGEPARFEALLAPFRAMVEHQLAWAARSSGGRKRERRRRDNPVRARLPAELSEPGLVCIVGEANAWPYPRSADAPTYPHELVHFLAFRLDEARGLELLIAPRVPLSRSPMVHSRLREEDLRGGISAAAFVEAFHAFMGPNDVLCSWGPYARTLLEQELGPLTQRFLDVRKVVGDYHKARAGSIEQRVAELDLPWQVMGQGRGGERLGMLVAVTRWLRALA